MVCEEGHKLGAASGAGAGAVAGAGAGDGDGAQCFIQPNSSLVLSASFDSARLIGQIRLTAVGGTIEMSRPMWEIAMSMGAALGGCFGRHCDMALIHPQDSQDSQRAAYSHPSCSLPCHESTDSHDNAKLQPQMLCYHLASPAQASNSLR